MACTWFQPKDGVSVPCTCYWVEADLCSACVTPANGLTSDAPAPPPEPLLFDAAGRPTVYR
jgi:hypothetical protein